MSYKSVRSILASGLDQVPLEDEPVGLVLPCTHEHVRGADYYREAAPGEVSVPSITTGITTGITATTESITC